MNQHGHDHANTPASSGAGDPTEAAGQEPPPLPTPRWGGEMRGPWRYEQKDNEGPCWIAIEANMQLQGGCVVYYHYGDSREWMINGGSPRTVANVLLAEIDAGAPAEAARIEADADADALAQGAGGDAQRTAEANGWDYIGTEGMLDRVAEIAGDYFDPRSEESVADGVQAMADRIAELEVERGDARVAHAIQAARAAIAVGREKMGDAPASAEEHLNEADAILRVAIGEPQATDAENEGYGTWRRAWMTAAARERVAALERALRLERGAPAEGDLPEGWETRARVSGMAIYAKPKASAYVYENGYWSVPGDGGRADTAAEAIDSAEQVLREAKEAAAHRQRVDGAPGVG